MFFKQFYLGCLAHASYLLGSDGAGVVIDPQRDVDQYVEEAAERGLQIRYIVETHLHADFVSGHRELAERTGATIVVGRRADATFPHQAVGDSDVIRAGSLELRILETPGHTPEGISLLVTDTAHPQAAPKLFTGDTLFIGDVGRPDLSGGKGFTPEQMAAMLFESLHEKVLPLDDRTEVYPAHGAGSLCGRNMSNETWSTLGKQRIENYALRPMSKDEFVALITAGLPETPQYFADDVRINREGAPPLATIPVVRMLGPQEVRSELQSGTLLLDVRPSEIYGPAHVPGSLNVGLDGQFASWAGTLIAFHQPLILLADGREAIDEAVMRLARIGFTSVTGALEGGMAAWQDAGYRVAQTPQITATDLASAVQGRRVEQLLDVRRPAEFETGAVPGALSIPLNELERHVASLDPTRKTYVVCGSGYRSSIATSILEAHGFANLVNLDGGMRAYNAEGFPTVTPAGSPL